METNEYLTGIIPILVGLLFFLANTERVIKITKIRNNVRRNRIAGMLFIIGGGLKLVWELLNTSLTL